MISKAVSFFFWVCLLIIPLSYNFWGLDPSLYSKFFLLDIALLLAAILIYVTNNPVVVGRSTLIFLALYACYWFISLPGLLAFGINKPDGWFVWLHLVICPVFVLLLFGINQIATIKKQDIAKLISWMAAISILIGLYQYTSEISTSGWSFSSSEVVKATFAHKNIFAEILLITFPFSCYLGSVEKKIFHRLIAGATCLMLIILLSRAVWLGFAMATIACVVTYAVTAKRNKLTRYHILLALSAILLIFFFGSWFTEHNVTGSKLATFYQSRNTLNERAHLWSATWQIIQLHPLLGSGTGSWKVLNMRYGIVGLRNYTTFFQQPHNDALWILSEQGVLAFIAVSAAWLYLLYILFKPILATPTNAFLYCLLFTLVGYWVYSNFGFPRERAEHGIILAFVAFFILKSDTGIETLPVQLPKTILLPISLLLIVAAWWAGNKLHCEIELRHFFEAREINDVDGEVRYLGKISPVYCTLDGVATPLAWYKGMAHFARKNMEMATLDFDDAVKANPYHAYSLANVGTCLSLKGHTTEAENYFRLSLLYSPGFPEAALNLAAIKFNESQTDSAAYYLGMAHDTLTNARYNQVLNVVMKACITQIINNARDNSDTIILNRYRRITENRQWMMHICKEAYKYKRTIPEQVNRDVVWTVAHNDKNPELAEKIRKTFKLAL